MAAERMSIKAGRTCAVGVRDAPGAVQLEDFRIAAMRQRFQPSLLLVPRDHVVVAARLLVAYGM